MDHISIPDGCPTNRQRFFNRSLNRSFTVAAGEDVVEMSIYDDIGFFGVTADAVRRQLDAITAPRILLRLNSPGGDAWDGIAIHNDFKAHPATVEVKVTGLAASAASIIAMAGDRIEIADNAFMMIHNAWTIALGDRHDMIETAALLEQVDAALARTYARRTGRDQADVQEMMDAETWMAGPEAVALGFADATGDEAATAALFDLAIYDKVPTALKRRQEAALRDAGYAGSEAKAAVNKGFQVLTQREAGSTSPHQREADEDSDLLRSLASVDTLISQATAGIAARR